MKERKRDINPWLGQLPLHHRVHNQVLSGSLGTLGVQHLAGAPGISIGLAPRAADPSSGRVPSGDLGGLRGTGKGGDSAYRPAENFVL